MILVQKIIPNRSMKNQNSIVKPWLCAKSSPISPRSPKLITHVHCWFPMKDRKPLTEPPKEDPAEVDAALSTCMKEEERTNMEEILKVRLNKICFRIFLVNKKDVHTLLPATHPII